ncbi:MAG: lipopolysaccharide/colanic/teichoic acid biosynthesis glycosyltransferase [Cyclobacteriaceae bacterium]|jgi:lipopolysaccharide/colanic/teichoic acid biosynthesis glycosyltransferase
MPLMIIASLMIVLVLKESPFFTQLRTGQYKAPFRIFKFKTMSSNPKGEETMTPLTKQLRRLGFDELPQLFNVLLGEMSLVGPRPLPIGYLSIIRPQHHLIYQVKPGITGLCQVSGGSALSWGKRFDYDMAYVAQASFKLDFRILFRTVQIVLGRTKSDSHEKLSEGY